MCVAAEKDDHKDSGGKAPAHAQLAGDEDATIWEKIFNVQISYWRNVHLGGIQTWYQQNNKVLHRAIDYIGFVK